MSPALVIGHPTALVCTLFLIPTYILIAVVLPGNQFLPLASLAGLFYLFPMMLPYTKDNVVKSYIIGFAALLIGYCIYALCKYAKYVGAIALATFTAVMVVVNHRRITKAERQERVANLETA